MFELIPPVFRCAEDEQVFYGRLHELPGLASLVVGNGRIRLQFTPGEEALVIEQLREICDVWHASFAPAID